MKYLRKFNSVQGLNEAVANSEISFMGLAYNNGTPVVKNKVVVPQPNDEIWYTSNDDNIVTPSRVAFGDGITVVSNTYSSGKGIIKLSGVATTIGQEAFAECQTLTSITIPNSVTEIGSWCFAVCIRLASITIPSSVTDILQECFTDCIGLTSVTINGVTEIGERAFIGCTGLTSVTINGGIIGDGAFNSCSNLTSLTVGSGVTEIGEYAFYDCSGLTGSLTIPNSVESIGEYAFTNCTGLTSLIINSTLISGIMNFTFSSCGSLTSITFPNYNEIMSFGIASFLGCDSLVSINIPLGVIEINESAFDECTGLTSITIPESVEYIGNRAFWCQQTTSLTCLSINPPHLDGDYCFIDIDCPIYVPAASVDAYKAASGWSDYASRIQAIPS